MNVPTPLLEERSVDNEGTVMEKCLLGNKIVFLPQEICEQEEIFKKVMSLETWDSVLSETQRSHLMKFLPSFSENDQDEKKDILRKLFDGENFKFGNPLRTFFKKLHDGVMAPDVAKMTALLRKATYREYRYQQQQYYCRLLQQILISRKKLLDAASTLPPHQHVKIEQFTPKTRDPTLEDRTKWRYFSELQSVREECGELDTSSEDENYPEGSPLKLTKKHKKQLHNLEAALNPDMHRVVSTIATGSGIHNSGSGRFICRSLATCEMTEERYREMIVKHKTRELDRKKHPELDVSNISLEGLITRTNITRRPMSKPLEQHVKKRSKNTEALEKKSKTPRSTTSEPQALDGASGNSQEPIPQPPVVTEASNIKVENKTAPEQPEDDEDMDVDIGSDGEAPFVFPARASTPEQEGNLPVSFFSLLRDLFLSTPEMKMSAVKLEERVRMWLESPVVVGCDWLGGHDNWTELVSSALKFLAGDLIAILPENFVPYLDYKEKQQQWQWIGAGRDSDKQLCALCQQWQENLGDVSTEALESAQGSPPPPRVPTDWSVRPSNEEEKKSYREQECIRYQNPHKAYTFRVHGYEAVVGPVKGVYRKETGVNKAREHSLLVSDRPPFVTILSLVRDAAARLPNGEGTRADISELLKDSQYLAPGSDQQMYAMVSGALDRLHYEKDPCVKYDVNRKLWIYLHRNRTEEEFEKIHQAQAAAAKAKKAIQKTKVSKVKAKETLRPASTLAMSAVIDSAAITTVTDITVNVTSSRSGGSRSQSSPKQGHPAVSRQLVRSLSMPTSTQNNIKANLSGLSLAVSSTATTPILNSPQKHALDATSKALVSPNIISAPKLSTLMSVTATGLPHNGGSNSRPPSQGSSQSLPSPKTVIANVNAAQFMGVTQLQSVVSTGDQPLSSPLTSSTPPSGLTTMDMKPSSPAFVGQPPVLQPVFNQNLPGMVNLTFPTAARGTATAGSRRTSGTSATHSVPTSSTLQNLQTIVVKQEAGGKSNSSVATLPILATGTAASTMRSVANVSKPMVARLVSGSQMVSLGSLVPASAGLVTSQPGMAPAGASTIHIQGNSFVRPVGAAAQLNVLQTNQLATAGVKLNRLTLMTQGSNATTTSLSPNVLISQPKLLSVTQGQLGLLQAAQLEAINSATQVTPIPIPTSHSSSPAKAANSSGPSSSVATSPLPGKPSQTLVMSPKGTNQFAAGGTSVSLGSSLPSVIFATSSPGSSSAVVFACQGSLKTTQTYMMAAPGAPPAVIMATAAQQGIRGAAVTPLNVKALQGIKVIPMSQTVAPVKGCKGQPLFARIITPSGGIALHPTGTVTAGLGQQMTGSAAVSIVQGLGPLPMQSSSSLVVSQSCSPGKSTANTLPATISQPLVVQPTASSTETPTTSKE